MINRPIEYEFFLPANVLPKEFVYPETYVRYIHSNFPNLEPWNFFYNHLKYRFNGLKERYPKRSIVPFARRKDNDDVACFEAKEPSENPRVIIIHDWASEGWENRGEYDDFLEWVQLAKEEAEEWKEFWKNYDEKSQAVE